MASLESKPSAQPLPLARDPAAWLLATLGLSFFARVLFWGQTLYFRDLYQFYLPQKALIARRLANLEIPLWNDLFHTGMPLLADISNGALYPANALYWLLSPIRALNVDIALHTIGASLAAYALGRHFRLGQPAAVAVALVYSYSGFALSSIPYLVAHQGRMYLPWMLLVWVRYLATGDRRAWLVTTVLGTLQVLAGRPEVVAVTHLTLLTWTLVMADRGRWRQLGANLGLTVAVIGLAAVQLVPMAGLAMHSSRGAGLSFASWSWWSLWPARLLELLVPGFFGAVDTFDVNHDYWGMGRVDGFPYFPGIYVGVLTGILALTGATSPAVGRRLRWLLATLAVTSIALSLGRHWPFFETIYQVLPPVRIFRFPSKLLELSILPIGLLAGFGLERMDQEDGTALRRATRQLGAAALGALLVAALLRWLPHSAIPLTALFNRADDLVRSGLAAAFGHVGAVALIATLILFAKRGQRSGRQIAIALAALLAFDLAIAGRRVNPVADDDLFTRIPGPVPAVRAAVGDGRLFRTKDPEPPIKPPTNESFWRYAHNRERLDRFLATSFGIPVAYHVDFNGLASKEMLRLARALHTAPWKQRLGPLAAADVRIVASSYPLNTVNLLAADPGEAAGLYLYRNPRASGPAVFVPKSRLMNSADEALSTLLDSDFDPRRSVILDVAEGNAASSDNCPTTGGAQIVTRRPEHWSVTVEAPCAGFLVLQQGFDRGWQTRVDGAPIVQRHANVAFTAIPLPAGVHQVERRYRPVSVATGLGLSLATVLFLVVATIRRRRP